MVCIDMFKAPYKAVLIQLYEAAVTEKNEALQKEIEEHFDRHFTQNEWEQHFKRLKLDVSLIQPSNILDMRILENAIQSKQETYPKEAFIVWYDCSPTYVIAQKNYERWLAQGKAKIIKSKHFSVATTSRAIQRAINSIFYWSAMKNGFNTALSQEHVLVKSLQFYK